MPSSLPHGIPVESPNESLTEPTGLALSGDTNDDTLTSNGDQVPSISKDLNAPPKLLYPDDATTLSVASIVGAYAAAAALALGHHFFLAYLHNKNINGFSQLWIKAASNGFASAFTLCLVFGITSALTQMKWLVASSNTLRIEAIDSLFALPSPLALGKTVARPRKAISLPILTSFLIHSLVLVSILTPGALNITQSARATQNMSVLTLDLSEKPEYDHVYGDFDPPHMSIKVETIMDNMIINPGTNLRMPPECGHECSFNFTYKAPALDCRDMTRDEYLNQSTALAAGTLYEASSNFYSGQNTSLAINSTYYFSILYVNLSHTSHIPQSGAGVYCRFWKATYIASFNVANNIQHASTNVVDQESILVHRDYRDCYEPQIGASDMHCLRHMKNTYAICSTFAGGVEGGITQNGHSTSIRMSSFFGTMFSGDILAPKPQEFGLLVPNISESLTSHFSNLTLALIQQRSDRMIVTANTWDGTNVWEYTTWILWGVYLPALLLAIPFTLSGLLSIRASGVGMDTNFSTFLLTTRNPELDDMCKQAREFDDIEKVPLVYKPHSCFIVAAGAKC